MKKIIITIIFLSLIFFGGLGSFLLPHSEFIITESRKTAVFPRFGKRVNSKRIIEYFKEIDRFANDNLPGRNKLLGNYRYFINIAGDQIDADKAFHGKGNWLFLGNYYNQNIDKFEGKIQPDINTSPILDLVIEYSKQFQHKNIDVTFLLGPRKESVYPEYLPAIIKPSPDRFITPFLAEIRNRGIPAIDPTQALKKNKHKAPLYWQTDTHWNLVGGSIAFQQFSDHIGIKNCPSFTFMPDKNYDGDLIDIGLFNKSKKNLGDNFSIKWTNQQRITVKTIHEETIPAHSQTNILKNQDASQKEAIWIIGDSFRGALVPFISHCFSETRVFHIAHNTKEKLLDEYIQAELKPKYILIVITERSF